MIIRPLGPGDRTPLLALAAEVFSADEIEVASELLNAAADGSPDYWIQVAADTGDAPAGIGGYVCYGPTPMTAGTYDLYWIGCHPMVRGRGIASALIGAMERDLRARGGTAVRVETEDGADYAAARRLYERFAYPVAARLPDFYRPGAGLVIYYKLLPT